MKKILGAMRRCCEDFNMIAPGDRIAVGVSGGKDSMLLLTALAMYRDRMGIPFEVEAITLMTGIPVSGCTPSQHCRTPERALHASAQRHIRDSL